MANRFERVTDTALNEKHSTILKKLLAEPGNRCCADCKKPDPRWASWNLGIFICIQCSGAHRSLGTHVSKVKSVDLDTWVPEQIESMVQRGNERANQYWEELMSPDERPGRTGREVEDWVRAKYVQKRWVKGHGEPSSNSQKSTVNTGHQQQQSATPPKPSHEKQPEKKDARPSISSRPPKQLSPSNKTQGIHRAENLTTEKVQGDDAQKQQKQQPPKEKQPAPVSSSDPGYTNNLLQFQQQLSLLRLGIAGDRQNENEKPSAGIIPPAPPGYSDIWSIIQNRDHGKA